MTTKRYKSEVDLRNDLAILDEWGIKIDRVTTFKPSKGTWISEGNAAKKVGDFTDEIRSGGGFQGLIDSKNLPKSTWKDEGQVLFLAFCLYYFSMKLNS